MFWGMLFTKVIHFPENKKGKSILFEETIKIAKKEKEENSLENSSFVLLCA